MQRRSFLQRCLAGAATVATGAAAAPKKTAAPNILYIFADQWRAQATGYAGDPNVKTPNLDRLAQESINFSTAVSTCPVCSPYRASLLTGCYADQHGVFLNDVCLRSEVETVAESLKGAGYQTAYIGKWHLDGHGRSSYIPPERRQGFDFWRVLECTHNYNESPYYGDRPEKRFWEGYDAEAQTREAQRYLREETGEKPFVLFLSWGPPHNPYQTAPERFRKLYDPEKLKLRGNVPQSHEKKAREELAGYYAHCTALDTCLGDLLDTLRKAGLAENTIVVFTSDHGDMLHSQGEQRKQRPYDEAIRVPFLLRWPEGLGAEGREITAPISTPDIMPSLLGLAGVMAPAAVQGDNLAPLLRKETASGPKEALISCYSPFGEWTRPKGGREYRGLRTERYTYVRDLNGPWLLFDNQEDPLQQRNLVELSAFAEVQKQLDQRLDAKLAAINDGFKPGHEYIQQWGYTTDKEGTAPYKA